MRWWFCRHAKRNPNSASGLPRGSACAGAGGACHRAEGAGAHGPDRRVHERGRRPRRAKRLGSGIYDPQGYQLETYRYKPDGSLWVHTIIDRKGPLVLRTQVAGTAPFESGSTQNVFDAQEWVIETDTYDANGVLVSRSKGEFVEQQPNSSTYRRTERKANGTESTAESIETTDPETGITHQVGTRDGKTAKNIS